MGVQGLEEVLSLFLFFITKCALEIKRSYAFYYYYYYYLFFLLLFYGYGVLINRSISECTKYRAL